MTSRESEDEKHNEAPIDESKRDEHDQVILQGPQPELVEDEVSLTAGDSAETAEQFLEPAAKRQPPQPAIDESVDVADRQSASDEDSALTDPEETAQTDEASDTDDSKTPIRLITIQGPTTGDEDDFNIHVAPPTWDDIGVGPDRVEPPVAGPSWPSPFAGVRPEMLMPGATSGGAPKTEDPYAAVIESTRRIHGQIVEPDPPKMIPLPWRPGDEGRLEHAFFTWDMKPEVRYLSDSKSSYASDLQEPSERHASPADAELSPRTRSLLSSTPDSGPPMARPIVVVSLSEDRLLRIREQALAEAAASDVATLERIAQEKIDDAAWVRACHERAIWGNR
jgi:hypothetical protein